MLGIALAIQCAAVKARDIAKTDLDLYRRQGRNWFKVEAEEHWFARLLAEVPNEFHSWTEFWRMVVLHLELAQNAYILIGMDRAGRVTELLPLMPARTRPRISVSGRLFYEVNAATEFERAQLGESRIIVPAERIIHLRGKLLDGLQGLSNALLGNPLFGLLDAINRYQTELFGNDGKQPLVFETDQAFGNAEMADAAFRRLKNQLAERTRKARAQGDPILLEAGLKAKVIALNAQEALTTEAFNQQVERICGLMETPPHKIFHYNNVKYENQASADNQYANDCLVPTAANIEEKLRNALLPKDEWRTFYPQFNRRQMLWGDPNSLVKLIDVGITRGIAEINEVREWAFQANPIPGGDVRLVPVNTAMVDRDGNVVQAATGQNQGTGQEQGAGQQAGNQSRDHWPRLVHDNG
jgi:HK97 family phage portal protein